MGDPFSATLGVLSLLTTAASAGYSAYSSHQAGKAEASMMRERARQDAEALMMQSEAEQRQAADRMQDAANAKMQAAEELRQSEIENQKAIIEQEKGEREAHRRSILLANEIGSQYANYAANGLLVDSASPTDTFETILKTTTREGAADISAIQENAMMNKWSIDERKRALQIGAGNTLAQANNLSEQAKTLSLSAQNSRDAAEKTLAYGYKAASNAFRAGNRQAISYGISGAASTAGNAYSMRRDYIRDTQTTPTKKS